MKHISILIFLVATLLLNSCSNKTAEFLSKGDEAYSTNNYELALLNWEKIISSNQSKKKKVDPNLYAKAGFAALKTNKNVKATDYLSKAYNKGIKSPELLLGLADVYRKNDNLSYELTYLKELVNENGADTNINNYKIALFDAYKRSENWDQASSLWVEIDSESKKNVSLLSSWLDVQKALKNEDECFTISTQILKTDPKHILAREITAKHFYTKAETLYQKEIQAYNAHKTRSQYNKLLKALKIATADFKKAKIQYESLYKETKDKKYAQFLSNVFARLNNKQKSDYYKKLAK